MKRQRRRHRGMAAYQTVLIVAVFAMVARILWLGYREEMQPSIRNAVASQLGPVEAGYKP